MARYEVAVFSFLFLGLFSFLGRVGVTPQVRLKSCQSCVSALRHSQNVCFLATGRHDCLKHFISMSSCVNNSKIKTVFIYQCGWNYNTVLCTFWRMYACRPVTGDVLQRGHRALLVPTCTGS